MAVSQRAVDIDPELADGHKALGLAYRVGGDDDTALVHYFRAVELDPSHFGAVANIGSIYFGRGAFAEYHLWKMRAFRLSPNAPAARTNVAWSYLNIEEYDLSNFWGARPMSIPIVEGRRLEWTDQGDQMRGIVISETLARTFWPSESAVGRLIRSQGAEDGDAWEVVGVAGNVRFDDVQEEPLALAYLPVLSGTAESPRVSRSMDVVVRVGGDPLDAIQGVREALRFVDPRLPMINPRTVETIVEQSMASTSFTVLLLGIAAGVAVLLGTVGIYGVIAYIVSRRTQEIGVRMALGAPPATVLKGVMGQGMALVGIGVAIGLLGSWGLSRALASLLCGVTATDPLTFAGTAGLLAVVSLLATWIPARRAAHIDPVEALRSE